MAKRARKAETPKQTKPFPKIARAVPLSRPGRLGRSGREQVQQVKRYAGHYRRSLSTRVPWLLKQPRHRCSASRSEAQGGTEHLAEQELGQRHRRTRRGLDREWCSSHSWVYRERQGVRQSLAIQAPDEVSGHSIADPTGSTRGPFS